MGRVRKKQEVKSKKLTVYFEEFWQAMQKSAKEYLQKAEQFVKNIPGWVKSRPEAFRQWKAAEKKKKKYRSFRLQKRIKPEPRYVPPAAQLLRQTFKLYIKNFWVFLIIMFVHACLYYLFVRGSSSFDLQGTRESIKAIFGEDSGSSGTFALLGSVLGSNQQREGSSMINVAILLLISLADIWVIRRIYANTRFKVRDAFYQGPGAFVPFVLILLVMMLQALPFTFTSYMYIIGRSGGLFISGVEDLLFFLLAVFCGLLSLYWMVTSIIALYAVTLPNMYPVSALRLTRNIVKFRRFLVFRRIVIFPVLIGIISLGILLLIVRFAPQSAPLLVEAFIILLLPILHGYYFNLYRSLL